MLVTVILRTLLFYFTVLFVMRVMGKREIAKISPFDLVVIIMIADAAVMTIEDPNLPIWTGVIAVGILALLQVGTAVACMKSQRLRTFISGRPSLLIENGRINQAEMRRLRYNVDELLAGLRQQGFPNPNDVAFALLEVGGGLSVIPKAEHRPVTVGHLNLTPPGNGLALPLVVDGEIRYDNLKKAGLDPTWLLTQLRNRGIRQVRAVFLAMLNDRGELVLEPKEPVRGLTRWLPV